MHPVIVNILFFLLGAVCALLALALIRRYRRTVSEAVVVVPSANGNGSIKVTPHPQGTAREALVANLANLRPLFIALARDGRLTPEIHDAIIDINNKELMEIWVKISKSPEAIRRIFAMWGIRKEDEAEFTAQPYHRERYTTARGEVPEDGFTYTVSSPCWILTTADDSGRNRKSVIFKGQAERK